MDPTTKTALLAYLDEAIERINDADEAAIEGIGLSPTFVADLDTLRQRAAIPLPLIEYIRDWPDLETQRQFEDVQLKLRADDLQNYIDMLKDGSRSGGMPGSGSVRAHWPTGEIDGGILWILNRGCKEIRQPSHVYSQLRAQVLRCLKSWSRRLSKASSVDEVPIEVNVDSAPPEVPLKISARQQQAYDFVALHGPASATRIANHLNISTESFYARYAKVLRKLGVENSDQGYFVPR